MNNFLCLKNLTKTYNNKVVVNNLNISIKRNAFVTFLGPSGSGKTTILKLINGFEQPNSGDILLNGKSILNIPPNKRKMSTVFQNYALFPHLNVYDNISYALKVKKSNKKNFLGIKKSMYTKEYIKNKVNEIINIVDLKGKENFSPMNLSGGQQQRVAIARSLIGKPEILLLDEPLGSLDLALRKEMQIELKKLHKNFGITFIYVTHDQEEALSMSTHVIVIKDGTIQQEGKPIDIYNEPINKWVASFIGYSNIIEATYKEKGIVEWDNHKHSCIDFQFTYNEKVDVVLRPEDIDIVSEDEGFIKGIVSSTNFRGVHWEIKVKTKNFTYLINTTDKVEIGLKVGIKWELEDIHVMKK